MTTGIESTIAATAVIILIGLGAAAQLRKSRNIYGKLWGPLTPLVKGSARDSRLIGTYQGLPIAARIGGDGGETPSYFYELTATPGPAPQDWALSFTGEKFLGTGTKTWRVKSKDDALRQRLTDAGAAAAMQAWSRQPEITFKGKNGTLHYWEKAEGMYDLPSVEAFQAQLDLLTKLSAMNRQANGE
jgi:hypothetical protein